MTGQYSRSGYIVNGYIEAPADRETPLMVCADDKVSFRSLFRFLSPGSLPSIMHTFTGWLETTAVSVWIRESPSLLAFPFILIVHAWGMGFLAGANAAVDLRVLGFAPKVPLQIMEKFYPVMWFGFVINAISGVLLLVGYPTKALTNPVFFLKLGCIAVGMLLMLWIRAKAVRVQGGSLNVKLLAGASLLIWAGAICSGRFLAYTCNWLLADFPC